MTAVVQDNHAMEITVLHAEHRQTMDVLDAEHRQTMDLLEANHALLIASLNEEIRLLRARGGEILGLCGVGKHCHLEVGILGAYRRIGREDA